MVKGKKATREKHMDIMKGLLIILVVVGHSTAGTMHDLIYLFHMPLFFIISGFFISNKSLGIASMKRKIGKLMLPYWVYLFIDVLMVRRDFSPTRLFSVLWGGRYISGVYWYITAFLFAQMLFYFVTRYIPRKAQILIILIAGIAAIMESNMIIMFADSDKIVGLLKSPGIPWNLDVSLLILVYLAVGFYFKDQINKLLKDDNRHFDIVAILVAVLLAILCGFNYGMDHILYYFDMKPVYYRELVSAILIPCAFGLVIVRIIHWMMKIRLFDVVSNFLSLCGQSTIPIMFMHIPLNHWKDALGYGRSLYILIGAGLPLLFTVMFYRIPLMRKLFGFPEL